MKLAEIKNHLITAETVSFKLPNGEYVPEYFHVTEVGLVTKHFIDCGGTERFEKLVSFQLWNANDYEHRLKPQKLLHIISLSERQLNLGNLEIEVEYQSDTIGKYDLSFNGNEFELIPKHIACLAEESCGIVTSIAESETTSYQTQKSACTPGGSCC